MLRDTPEGYGLVSKLLHWSVAALILGLVWLGWTMVDLTYYDRWYNASLESHRALGLLALALAAANVIWSLPSRQPSLGIGLAPWERLAARATHLTLFGAMLGIPASGYLVSTSAGDAVSVFGWFQVPALWQVSEEARDLAIEIHYWLTYGTLALVCLHVGAALKHQFLDRDGTLRRMLW